MYKFRTMVPNADNIGGASTSARDPRITSIGHFLRRWKLDELPQLFNVISGDMSLVGPRPTLEWDVERYSPDERRLLTVKPGITDWASIRFRNEGELLRDEPNPDEAYDRLIRPHKIALGLLYVDNASLRQDLVVLIRTLKVILERRSQSRPTPTNDEERPAFHAITEGWSTPADTQQWKLASQRYSIAASLSLNGVLIEVGSGTGYGLSKVARFTQSAIGLDVDELNVAAARRHAPHCKFIRGAADRLPFATHAADCVAALEMLYYLPDQDAFLAEAWRVLRPGGSLLLTMPNPERRAFSPSPMSTRYPTRHEIERMVLSAGFAVDVLDSLPLADGTGPTEALRRLLVRTHLVPATIERRARLKSLIFRDMRRLAEIGVSPECGRREVERLQTVRDPEPCAIMIVIGTAQ